MQKIMIICFYDLIEYFASIKKSFIKYGYNVCHYPLFRYAYDQYDKKKDYLNHFIDTINEEKPDIILWCFIDISSDIFILLKKKFQSTLFILFNFDEPMNINPELFKKAETCDIVVTTSKEYTNHYTKHANVKHILYNPFGCDPDYYYNLKDVNNTNNNEFVCDIGMVCHNLLYDTNFFNEQYINRKEMIDNIVSYCNKSNKIFKLFGNCSLKEFYPDNYSGDISYINKNKLYNDAKIIICTQSFCNKSHYIDENIFSIMSSGGLILTDKSKDIEQILTNKHDVIFMDKKQYIRQINEILNNYDKYVNIRNNAIVTSKLFTWDKWVEKIHTTIIKHLFDNKIYADIYNLDINNATYEHWIENGLKNNHIAVEFKIPNNFNFVEYAKKYSLDERSREYLYYHWYHFDKSDLFFGNENNNTMFDPSKYNISMEKFMELCTYFDGMKYDCANMLDNINIISKQHPNCNINELLNIYLKLTE